MKKAHWYRETILIGLLTINWCVVTTAGESKTTAVNKPDQIIQLNSDDKKGPFSTTLNIGPLPPHSPVSQGSSCFAEAVADGSFELGDGSWTITGTAFNPLCNPTACGPDLASDGEAYLWIGGGFFTSPNEGVAIQSVVIPLSATTLQFDYGTGSNHPDGCESVSEDLLELLVDGVQVFRSPNPCVGIFPLITVSVDLAALGLNDGQTHELQFHGINVESDDRPQDYLTNIFLDNVSLKSPVAKDTDGDGFEDIEDNCSSVANADQRDTNGDGYGNACDADIDNNGSVNFLDLNSWAPHFGTADSGDEDFNGDGVVNFLDLEIMISLFLQPPGPSFSCASE